jgi:hypothetical protein
MGCTAKSASICHYSLRNDSEECNSVLIPFVMTHGFLGAQFISPAGVLLLFALYYFVVLKKMIVTV